MTSPADGDLEGILLVDKPTGISSHAVVARTRKALGLRKVGHAGTLDPDATGLLVIGVGRATRLLGYLTKADKSYVATIRFGVRTETDDAAGDVVETRSCVNVTEDDVRGALSCQVGEIDQVPSAVSAVKVEGRRAYARVRAGESVDLPSRRVTIHSLEILNVRRVPGDDHEFIDVDIDVRCTAGTYIRAIARDAGANLGVGGHVVTLRRTRAGAFDVFEAHSMDAVVDAGSHTRSWLISMREAALRSLPSVSIDAETAQAVRHGRVVDWPGATEGSSPGPTALVDDTSLVAIVEQDAHRVRYLAVFTS